MNNTMWRAMTRAVIWLLIRVISVGARSDILVVIGGILMDMAAIVSPCGMM